MTTVSTHLDVSRVALDHTYKFSEAAQDKADEWAEPLWLFLVANLTFNLETTTLRNVSLKDVLHERYVNYVYSRLVIAGCHELAKMPSTWSTEEQQDAEVERVLRKAVESVFDPIDGVRDKIVYYLTRLCPRIRKKSADPTDIQKSVIRATAKNEGHRCYLCGAILHYDGRPYGDDAEANIVEKRKVRTFTIEHLWSKARGGSRHRSNLGACCQDCNNLKHHLLSFADFPLEQVMTHSVKHESILTEVPKQARLALLWRQHGCCEMCGNRLFKIDPESLFLTRREPDEPYHFFNLMAVCGACNCEHQLHGVQIRA